MPVFIYHPTNKIGAMLKEMHEEEGFLYQARPQMEAILKDRMIKSGMDVAHNIYFHIGTMSAPALHDIVDKYFELHPENAMHKQILHHFKTKGAWAFVKVTNGRDNYVLGYCNSDPSVPFLMSSVEQAQAGVIETSFVPR